MTMTPFIMPDFISLNPIYHRMSLAAVILLVSPLSQAALPNMVEQALATANLSPSDISMVIVPVNVLPEGEKQVSRLPAAVLPKKPPVRPTPPVKTKNLPLTPVNAPADNPILVERLPDTHPIELDNGDKIQSVFRESDSLITPNNNQQLIQQQLTQPPQNSSALSSEQAAPSLAVAPTPAPPKPLATPLYHLANQPRTPASTMKLIPTFVALDSLGQDFVWQTQIFYTGFIVNGTLYGNMIIKGSGDPKLTHDRLNQLLYRAQKAGIHHIDGNIILDTSIFHQVGKNPAAFDNDPLRPYNASPDGLLVNFNSIQISAIPSDNGASILTYTPALADYQLPAILPQRRASCGSIKYSLAPVWQTNALQFAKPMPSGCGAHDFYIAYPDVADFARRVVKQKWQALGNTISGEVVTQNEPTTMSIAPIKASVLIDTKNTTQPIGLKAWKNPLALTSYPSQPLSAQIYDINHFSNNVMTEQLTLSLPVYAKNNPAPTNGYPRTSNYPSALANINTWWQTHLTTPPPMMSNGSGLCRKCTVTAANMAELLQYAYEHPKFATYVDSLGVAGISGTIAGHANRRPNSQAIGRAWIKTGTLDNVTAMAGYVKGISGQDYVVVGIINTEYSLNANKARPVLDAMLDWTAQH